MANRIKSADVIKRTIELKDRKRVLKAAESYTMVRYQNEFITEVNKLRCENYGKIMNFVTNLPKNYNYITEIPKETTQNAMFNILEIVNGVDFDEWYKGEEVTEIEKIRDIMIYLDTLMIMTDGLASNYSVMLYYLVILLDIGVKPCDVDWLIISRDIGFVDNATKMLDEIDRMTVAELKNEERQIAENWEDEYE